MCGQQYQFLSIGLDRSEDGSVQPLPLPYLIQSETAGWDLGVVDKTIDLDLAGSDPLRALLAEHVGTPCPAASGSRSKCPSR